MKEVPLLEVAPLTSLRVQAFDGERPYLATGDVGDRNDIQPTPVTYTGRPSRADLSVEPGDVCFARMAATTKVLEITREHRDVILSTGFAVLRPDPGEVHPGYLRHWLSTSQFQTAKDRLCSGATQKAITNEKMALLTMPLPTSIGKQRQIADILDKADSLRAKRLEALSQLNTLTQSMFLDMFGDPISNSRGWKTCRLEDVATTITDGTHKTPRYMHSGIEFLSAKDLKDGGIAWGSGKFISEEEHQELVKRCNPKLGDILLAKSGSLGNVAIIDRSHEFSLFESLCLIKYDRDLIDAQFLVGLLRTPAMLAHLLEKNKGIAIKHLHLIDIRSLRIVLPPLALQRAFAQRITSAGRIRSFKQASLAEFDSVISSLQHRAFWGKL